MEDNPHSGHRARIRSRYEKQGAEGFRDHELLELLLTYAIPRKDTNELAHRLLDTFHTLSGVLHAETARLTAVDGVGESTAVFLRLSGDVAARLLAESLQDGQGKTVLASPLAAARFAAMKMAGYGYETVLVCCLNSRRELLHTEVLQKGSLTEATVYPRAVAETALLRRAHGVLLLHNHPSGNPVPSPEDAETTAAVKAALGSIGVQLVDHMVTAGRYVYSFSANVILSLAGESAVTIALEDFSVSRESPEPRLKKVMERYE